MEQQIAYLCPLCRLTFGDPLIMAGHLIDLHFETSSIDFVCELCDKRRFSNRLALAEHIQTCHAQMVHIPSTSTCSASEQAQEFNVAQGGTARAGEESERRAQDQNIEIRPESLQSGRHEGTPATGVIRYASSGISYSPRLPSSPPRPQEPGLSSLFPTSPRFFPPVSETVTTAKTITETDSTQRKRERSTERSADEPPKKTEAWTRTLHEIKSENFKANRTCPDCNHIFPRIEILREHLCTWTCSICIEKFFYFNGYLDHIEKCHADESNFQCSRCKTTLNTRNHLVKHLQPIKCKIQREGGAGLSNPENEKTPTECPKCGSDVQDWDSHFYECYKMLYMCEYCKKQCKRKEDLDEHRLIHLEANPNWECQICEKTYKSQQYLTKHKKKHLEEAPCGHCLVFKNWRQSSEFLCTWTCELCQGTFRNYPEYYNHYVKNHGEQPIKCPKCKSLLSDHAKETIPEGQESEVGDEKFHKD